MGTAAVAHFCKYCGYNYKGCVFILHYGFLMSGSDSEVVYNNDRFNYAIFWSSLVTAFKTKMLSHLSAKMLWGKISYQQRSDIYNYGHGYDSTGKKSMSTTCASNDDA